MGSLLEQAGRSACVEPDAKFVRLPAQVPDKKGRASQRNATETEKSHKDFLAEPYLHTIFYINLDKSADRAASVEKQLKETAPGVHFERWKASNRTDAKKIDKLDYTISKEKQWPSDGTKATYLSHHHVMQHISEQTDPKAVYIVLEDDAALSKDWHKEVMCQIKRLPADWDLFKFGYWPMPTAKHAYSHTCSSGDRQGVYNEYSCVQRSFALEWMGNLGYALRPAGAKTALEHLRQVPVMDVDGAMMPGCCIKGSVAVPQNYFVSRYSLIKHGHFNSVRLMDKQTSGVAQSLDSCDDRESSYQARVRLIEAFKRGEMESFEPQGEEGDAEVDLEMERVQSLAGF